MPESPQRWQISIRPDNTVAPVHWPGYRRVDVVPAPDEAAVERAAQAAWNVHRQGLPGKGKGMEPPWPDEESGQCAPFYAVARAVLAAALEQPEPWPASMHENADALPPDHLPKAQRAQENPDAQASSPPIPSTPPAATPRSRQPGSPDGSRPRPGRDSMDR